MISEERKKLIDDKIALGYEFCFLQLTAMNYEGHLVMGNVLCPMGPKLTDINEDICMFALTTEEAEYCDDVYVSKQIKERRGW